MLAMVTNDQERENVSTTASDENVNPRWLKVCKKRSKKEAMRTEAPETLDLNSVHNIDEEKKITITIDSGAAASAIAQGPAPDRAEERRTREQVPPSGQRIKDTGPRRQEDHVQGGDRVHAGDELSTCGNKLCQGKNRVVFVEEGSYIENMASGRKVPKREENGVCVIDVHAKDLTDTGGPVFCQFLWSRERR